MNNQSQQYTTHMQSIELLSYGLTQHTEAYWVIYQDADPILIHRSFDPYGMYDAIPETALPKLVAPVSCKRLPAYSITDLLNIIPNVMLSKIGNTWEVATDTIFNMYSQKESLNEAVFTVARELLRKELLDIKTVNNILRYDMQYRRK